MSISHLEIQNFKSIGHTHIPLQDFTVLVGANAAGKSNIVQALQFLKDLSKEGLKDALSLQGGSRYFTNTQIQKKKESVVFHIQFALQGKDFKFEIEAPNTIMFCRLYELDYRIDIPTNEKDNKDPQSSNVQDTIYATGYYKALDLDKMGGSLGKQIDSIKRGFSDLQQTNAARTTLHIHTTFDTTPIITYTDNNTHRDITSIGKTFFTLLSSQSSPQFATQALQPFFLLEDDYHFGRFLREYLVNIGIYDFSTAKMKQGSSFEGRTELEPDGSNLAFVLKHLLDDAEKRKTLLNLLSYVLPYIADIHVEQTTHSWVASITEQYDKDFSLPSVFFSDGTMSVLALLTVLFFENKPTVVIEEPERYIHPALLSRLVELCKDAARNKQIIITTHSPEIVKHAGVDNLLLVQRDKEGFTTVAKPADSETLSVFLRNDIGLDDLFIDNLLGA